MKLLAKQSASPRRKPKKLQRQIFPQRQPKLKLLQKQSALPRRKPKLKLPQKQSALPRR